jgi:starvation-inducible DNA-binding protein
MNIRQQLLYDLRILLARAQFVHWNFRGPNFMSVHPYLDGVMEKIEDFIDWMAEDLRRYGVPVDASLRGAIANSMDDIPMDRESGMADLLNLSYAIAELVRNVEGRLTDFTQSEQSSITAFTDDLDASARFWMQSMTQ